MDPVTDPSGIFELEAIVTVALGNGGDWDGVFVFA
jgi:hypothetical protein